MAADFDDIDALLTKMKRVPTRVIVVFVDHIARIALEPILRHLDRINVLLVSLELNDAAHVQRFLGSSNVDSVESFLTTRQLAVGAYQLAGGTSDAAQTHNVGLAISKTTGGGHVVVHSQQATHQCTFGLASHTPESARIQHLRSLIVDVLARECGLAEAGKNEQCDEQSSVAWLREPAQPHWQELVAGKKRVSGDCPEQPLLFPGSFHPIHEGHRQMAAIASTRLNQAVHLEISVTNADKPELDFLTIGHRVREAETVGPVVLTQAPKFVDKARLFPRATFVIGADTAIRLDDVRFYDGSTTNRDEAIQVIADHGCRFLVFGRLLEQTFHDAENLSLTGQLRRLCEFVPITEFRVDVSSRELRRQAEQRPT